VGKKQSHLPSFAAALAFFLQPRKISPVAYFQKAEI
jgi:hypothetical protein